MRISRKICKFLIEIFKKSVWITRKTRLGGFRWWKTWCSYLKNSLKICKFRKYINFDKNMQIFDRNFHPTSLFQWCNSAIDQPVTPTAKRTTPSCSSQKIRRKWPLDRANSFTETVFMQIFINMQIFAQIFQKGVKFSQKLPLGGFRGQGTRSCYLKNNLKICKFQKYANFQKNMQIFDKNFWKCVKITRKHLGGFQ